MKFNLTFIDLFAGCGGLSEGFYKQGFKPIAHVEHDHYSCKSLKMRMKHYGFLDTNSNIIEKDLNTKEWEYIYNARSQCKKNRWHNINREVQK